MLLKFAYQDFLDDRRFKNTTKTNIKNYEMILGKFVDYCIENQVVLRILPTVIYGNIF
ncbi:hypothetical protein [Peribacillus tepidiphilus]|uniref:hypothetical protein n=1 Tax=Peribacillus tepidiphilus TaxID=2652445 RepID=UPI0035B51C0A